MSDRKSYRQFCGLARALDHVGDRWTLLIVRELLLGATSFRGLERRLPGISPTLLAARITALVDDGLVERNDAPSRSKDVAYALTASGRALEPALLELIKWGAQWMTAGPGSDLADPAWAALALKALLEGRARATGSVHLAVGGTALTVRVRRGRREVIAGRHGRAAATVAASLTTALAVASGQRRLDETDAAIDGDASLAGLVLAP